AFSHSATSPHGEIAYRPSRFRSRNENADMAYHSGTFNEHRHQTGHESEPFAVYLPTPVLLRVILCRRAPSPVTAAYSPDGCRARRMLLRAAWCHNLTVVHYFRFASGLAISRAPSMKSCAEGLSARLFRVATPTGPTIGSSIGSSLMDRGLV